MSSIGIYEVRFRFSFDNWLIGFSSWKKAYFDTRSKHQSLPTSGIAQSLSY